MSLIISLLFVVLFGYFLIRMSWSIGHNLVQGMRLRRQLHQRLQALPLETALGRAGADPRLYLHGRPIHEIEREMHNCETCQAARQCQAALAAGVPTEQFTFCPNYVALFKPKAE
ncbi:MAG: hypothetical protein ABR553_02530 [Gammaproteobacteria bacterium]